MKFTLSWLQKSLDTTATLEEICDKLTAIGLEVEEVEDKAATYAPFKVAYIEKTEPHPDADKLKVCTVKTENGVQQVVCGAPNARAGLYGIFAPEGSYVPGLDMTMKKTKIRGVESCGMMASEREMELSDEHNGIIDLEGEPEIGTPMAKIFDLDDAVIEINVTPNRADCAGIYGIARDLAAAGIGNLRPISPPSPPASGGEEDAEAASGGSFPSPISIKIKDTQGCPLFIGRYIKGVKNGPSPEWLQKALKSIGLRPISALVDITNYITMGYARPLHAYDADKLKGNIVVSASKGGEELDGLNDKSYTLCEGAVTVNDDSGVIGLGGIVGGTSTGVDENTSNVLLECAYFDPMRIARSGRDMGIITDARYRFERGVDPEFVIGGMDLFTKMVLEICGGEASEIVVAGDFPEWKRVIEYDPAYCKQLIGVDVEPNRQKEILESLGFEVHANGKEWSITPPSWRGDVMGKADITEEVIRIVGFDDIPEISVRNASSIPTEGASETLIRTQAARKALAGRGYNECVTWSFASTAQAKAFGANDNQVTALTLKNPISSEIDVMRPSVLPHLIEAAKNNANRGYANVALSEVGPVFQSLKPGGQQIVAGGIRAGALGDKHWSGAEASRAPDLFDAKADAIAALEACGAPAANAKIAREASEHYHPGRSGVLKLGKNVLAEFGEIHPAVLEEMDIKGTVVGFEIFLENIPSPKKKGTEKPYLVLEPLQPLTKDFAFLVDEKLEAADLIRAAKSSDKALITDAEIFDVYQGKGVENGKKSVALSITIQPKGESLTDKQLDELMQNVIAAAQDKCAAALRG